jgi:hypothetical protein
VVDDVQFSDPVFVYKNESVSDSDNDSENVEDFKLDKECDGVKEKDCVDDE